MLMSAPAFLTKIVKLAAAAALAATSAPSAAQKTDGLKLGYLASFGNGSLEPSVDPIDIGAMKEGHSHDDGNNPSWVPMGGDLVLQVTRPAALVGRVASVGVFATPVHFGPGVIFKARATFIKPVGPHSAGDIWAMVVGARTGDQDDLFEETRVGVSLQVRGTSLRLNAPGSGVSGQDLPADVYAEIFSPTDPLPFTLELLVDRINGGGTVSLIVGDRIFSRNVPFPPFPATSNPVIEAVGPSLGMVSAAGQTASVHLREFRLLLPSASRINDADTCGAAWEGFNCREAPK